MNSGLGARVRFLLVIWGFSVLSWGQAPPHVVKVAGDTTHRLVLFSDGRVAGWGRQGAGQLGPAAAGVKGVVWLQLPGKAVDIATTDSTAFAVMADGSVWAWGDGRDGQLGAGPDGPARSEAPLRVAGISDAVQIGAGGRAAVVLLRDGTVRAWGSRGMGMMGDGRGPKRYGESGVTTPVLTPAVVPNATRIQQISAGPGHLLALTNDGRVLAWGSNHYGALGRSPHQELPIDEVAEVPGLTDVTAVAAGNGVSTVLKRDGTVWVWGANLFGQFGNGLRTDPPGVSSGYELTPQRVPGVSGVVSIAVGIAGRHTLALLKDGTLRGWGNTDWGQLGAGVSGTFQERPVVPKLTGVKAVFAAGNNSFAVRNDNTFWIWGSGGRGEWPLLVNTKTPVPLVLQ